MLNNKQTQAKVKNVIIGCMASSLLLIGCGGSTKPADAATADSTTTAAATTAPATDMHYKASDLVDLDLSSQGIFIITKAPKDAKLMKYKVNGDVCVYGGKFFKLTFAKMEGAAADNYKTIKAMTEDKEMNASFDKFESEEGTSFLKKNKEGKLAFTHMLDADGATIVIQEGMPYDISPDQFSDYPADDVKVMYEAAKATKVIK